MTLIATILIWLIVISVYLVLAWMDLQDGERVLTVVARLLAFVEHQMMALVVTHHSSLLME